MRNFASVLTPPVLDGISNEDGDGNYTVRWSASTGATTYTLQEAVTADFSSPSTIYTGAATAADISNRSVGIYYNRVRASNAHTASDWSYIASVEVTAPSDCPATGNWPGLTSQGAESGIGFEVQNSPTCRIPESELGVNPKFGFVIRFWDSCATERNFVNLEAIPIVNSRFEFLTSDGIYRGEFTAYTTASGTFSYNNGSCWASGTWTAELPPPGAFSKTSPATRNELTGTWTALTTGAAWTARNGHTSVVLPDGSLVLMGGYDGSAYLNDVWRSTDQAAAWPARTGHTSVVLPDGSLVLLGGIHSGGGLNDVWRFVQD